MATAVHGPSCDGRWFAADERYEVVWPHWRRFGVVVADAVVHDRWNPHYFPTTDVFVTFFRRRPPRPVSLTRAEEALPVVVAARSAPFLVTLHMLTLPSPPCKSYGDLAALVCGE
jgi:hypothetical protein